MANEIPKLQEYVNDPEFRRLEAQLRGHFWRKGEPVESWGFDYERFVNDPAYANEFYARVYYEPEKTAGRQAALDQMLAYFKNKTGEQTTPQIDVESIMGGLEPMIRSITEREIQRGRGSVSRSAQGAQTRLREQLAGSGLGRSGVASQATSGIEEKRLELTEGISERARARESEALLQLQDRIKTMQMAEELRRAGIAEGQIRDMLNYHRSLQTLGYQAQLQDWLTPEPGFWDYFAPILGGIGQGLAGLA